VPVDAFVHLAPLSSLSSAYQQLARLQHAGLAVVRRVDPGYLIGERPVGCWLITDRGRQVLGLADELGQGEKEIRPRRPACAGGPLKRQRPGDTDAPLLMATYRILAALVLDYRAGGQVVEVQEWEWPWVREARSAADEMLRVKMPAGALLSVREAALDSDQLREHLTRVLFVPDLGTAPVARYRKMLGRLLALREAAMLAESQGKPELVIATPDPDSNGTRSSVWSELVYRAGRPHAECPLRVRVVTWDWVAEKVTPWKSADLVGADESRIRARDTGSTGRSWPAPARSREQLLHVIGRHPYLGVDQLAGLLGTAVSRVRRLEDELVDEGVLRRIEYEELPRGGSAITYAEHARLGLVEITYTGRRRLAAWLGLEPAAAGRYHGLTGNGRREAGRRWKLLRTLAHTVGANGVFVAFAKAADWVRQRGGSDLLAEWRSAPACERRHCKPDGYGCYVRDGVPNGFFLEYDRGTEGAGQYAAKLRAYYSYRDSPQAARDYNGFPTVLFVTTDPTAEERIADQAYRAWFIRGTEALGILSTTTARIGEAPEGILGPIWRAPGNPHPMYWLPGGKAGNRFDSSREVGHRDSYGQTPRMWMTRGTSAGG
jgi:hypothetical protein